MKPTSRQNDGALAIMETENDGSSTGLGFKEPAVETLGVAPSTFRKRFKRGEQLFLVNWSVTAIDAD
jgi:hypothetical protein